MNKDVSPLNIIISGGGTGGHIYPAISIAQEILIHHPDANILFVGAKGKMEMEKIPKAGFKVVGLNISGIQRKLSISNLFFPFKLLISFIQAWRILRKIKPAIAIGVGGYASFPLLYMASRMGIPTMIHEQNSYPGIANKWLATRANKICVAYQKMNNWFPESKLAYTGNPIRNDILDLSDKRKKAIIHFGLNPDKKCLLVLGGSLGAASINEATRYILSNIIDEGLQLIWQTGKSYYEIYKNISSEDIHIYEFIYEMDLAYAAADIIVSRAGAGSISEIAVVGVPVILIPSPYVAEDHQTHNAQSLSDEGAAILLKDKDARKKLWAEIIDLLQSPEKYIKMKKNLVNFSEPDARIKIYNEIDSLLKK